jgi:NTE family protein
MAMTYSKTAIALQGGGALGAYSFGALKYIYESEPNLQLSSISGVSIGAFTAAIVASHPDNPIDYLQSFWKDLTVFHSRLLPVQVERYFAYFGNWTFYRLGQDYYHYFLIFFTRKRRTDPGRDRPALGKDYLAWMVSSRAR